MSAIAPTRSDDPRVLLVLTNLPDHDSATALAAALVEARLVACANVLAPCTSVYRWQGAVETTTEVPLLIKTTAARYPALEAAIRSVCRSQNPIPMMPVIATCCRIRVSEKAEKNA